MCELDYMKKELEEKKYFQASAKSCKPPVPTFTPKVHKDSIKPRMTVQTPTQKKTGAKTTRTVSKQTLPSKKIEP